MVRNRIEAVTLVGRPFAPAMMNDNQSFSERNAQVENDPVFQQFLKRNRLNEQRASLVIFAPESFMYWYGAVVTGSVGLPKGLMKYDLPAASVAQETSTAMANTFDLPLNFIVQSFFKKAVKAGLKIYQNPGYCEKPYLLQNLDLKQKKLTQTWYGQVSQ